MEIVDIAKLLGGGGFAVALLWLLYLVGMRIVAALDRVAVKVDAQGSAIDRVEVKVDVALAGLGLAASVPAPRAPEPPKLAGRLSPATGAA